LWVLCSLREIEPDRDCMVPDRNLDVLGAVEWLDGGHGAYEVGEIGPTVMNRQCSARGTSGSDQLIEEDLDLSDGVRHQRTPT